jgi:hypothetical protein
MYDQVREDIDEMISLLESDNSSWVQLFRKAKRAFDAQDYENCSSIILSGSGGMGSLNDLILGQGRDERGDFQWKDGYRELNDRFQVLLGRLYSFASDYRSAINARSRNG